MCFLRSILGLAPQALCCRSLRELEPTVARFASLNLPVARFASLWCDCLCECRLGGFAFFGEETVGDTSEGGADDGREPEKPELLESPAAGKNRRTRAASRINRRVGHRNS